MLRLITLLFVFMFMVAQGAYAVEHTAAGGKDDSEAVEGEVHPEFAYIDMDPINLPIITAKGLSQQVSIKVSLEIPYDMQEKVTGYKPRLVDAYIQDLYGAIGAGFAMMKGNILNVQQVKERLTSVTNKVLGPDLKANGVLLQVVHQQQM